MIFLANIDTSILHFFNSTLAQGWLDHLMEGLSNRNIWLIVALLGIGYAATVRNRDALYACFAIAVAVTLSDWICYEWIKPYFARNRPCYEAALNVRLILDGCGSQYGFPSNHAANGMSAAIVGLVLLGRRWGIFMASIACLVGLSRIYLGVHYPSDVLGGFFFALFFGSAGILISRVLAAWMRQVLRVIRPERTI